MRNYELNRLKSEDVKKLLFSLSVPAIIAQLVSLLYNVVDRMYIGHIKDVGGLALTGVGVTIPLSIIIAAFAILVGVGGAPNVSINMGKGRKDQAEEILGNCFTTLIIFSIILTAFFLVFNEKLLLLFGASENTLPYALKYMNICTLGTVFLQLSIGLNPFARTQGFAKESMITISIGAIINIILDPIFIYTLNMGVNGAALSTVVSQAVSAIWITRFLTCEKSTLKIKKKYIGFNPKLMGPVLFLGLSPFVIQFTESFVIILFNYQLQRYGGDSAVGAMTIASTAMQFLLLPLMGLAQGAQPIISYNYGAKLHKRVNDAFKYLLLSSVIFSIAFYLIIMIFPNSFVNLFTKDQSILREASSSLRIYMFCSFMLGVQLACQQTFIALGNATTSVFLAILRKVILLMPLVIILPNLYENKVFAVFLAEPISDVIATITTSILFYRYSKEVLSENDEEFSLNQ